VPKLFSVRFDVDTHRCIREGMPSLSALGAELGVPFTFFVNMGRAVSRPAVLGRLLGRRGATEPDTGTATKFSARRKLGLPGYVVAAVLNPEVGGASGGVIRRASRDGHEIGLHGGRNHAVWQAEAASWSAARVATEIDAVLPGLTEILGGERPIGFASPGWTSHPALPAILRERGFRYLADAHGADPGSAPPREEAADLPMVRTQLTGEPGGVAYLEHLRAGGLDDTAMTRRFEADLEAAGDFVVMYDHPYFAGVEELAMIRRLVGIVRDRGYEVVPMSAAAPDSGVP
jgi:peptidoglycan/xylan/chitin deacetylase (PgdA/CDA1 family)